MRTFDVEVSFAFRATMTGRKVGPQATKLKQRIRRQLRAAGIKDAGCVGLRVSERGKNPPL